MKNANKNAQTVGGQGAEETQPGKLPVDSTLCTLLRNVMELPPGQCELVPGGLLVSDDLHLYALAIHNRGAELGGEPLEHLLAAMDATAPGWRR